MCSEKGKKVHETRQKENGIKRKMQLFKAGNFCIKSNFDCKKQT